jgi:hypothetical protein
MSPTDPTPDVGALARDVERVTRRVEALAPIAHDLPAALARVAELDESVEKLGNLLADVMDRMRGEQTEARAWLLVADPEQARSILTDLVAWLDAVYLRYPGAALPACWLWHPSVIEELWWLRTAHAEAYSGRGWGVRAGMWHDQQRPRVVERIRQSVGTCDLKDHVSGGQQARLPVAAPLAGHVVEIAEAWTATGLPPEPTHEQLEDSRSYDVAQVS